MISDIEYLSRRMSELGSPECTFRYRHFVLQPGEDLEIEAWQELLLLTHEVCDIQISSDFGVFDLSADNVSELQYEHQGLVTIKNTSSAATVHVRFLQAIPKTTNNGNKYTEIRTTEN